MERLEFQPDVISEGDRFPKKVQFDTEGTIPYTGTVEYGTSVAMRITRCAQNKTDKNISQVRYRWYNKQKK
jgi:hypothetical protein